MKAFIVDQYKKAEARRMGEIPIPELEHDDVLVKVHAASVNPLRISCSKNIEIPS